MRMLWALVPLAAVAALGTSTVVAQDGAATVSRSYDLAGFDHVSIVGPHHVTVSVGPAYSVRIDGPQQSFDDSEIVVEDGRLKIQPIENERWRRDWDDREWREFWDNYQPLTVHVTLPAIEGASLVGGGDMHIDRVEGEDFAASIAGSGELDVAALRVADARFSVAGSGDLTARGSATRSRVSIAGSGNLHAREVTSTEASVSIAGSGNAELTVNDDAHISLVGGGDVDIAGAARCSVSRIGGGRVRCGGDTITS